jgi:hypothetical protein
MKSARKPAARWPWDPVPLELYEISAIKAMASQHPAAFEVVCVKLCRERQLSFTVGLGEDGIRATDYAEGKRAVAEQLRALVAMKMPGPPIPKDEGPHAVPKGEPPKD